MIRAKLILRNVVGKPLRTIIIILSLAAAAFVALFCISGINSVKNNLRAFFFAQFGDADMVCIGTDINIKDDEFPQGTKTLSQVTENIKITQPNEKYVKYVSNVNISVIGIDTQKALEMGLFESAIPTEDGATITTDVAKQFDKKIGDTFDFYGCHGKEYSLKILEIVSPKKMLARNPMAVIVTPELCCEIKGVKSGSIDTIYADIPEEHLNETILDVMAKHRNYAFMNSTGIEAQDALNNMLSIYYLIFAVVFLMVCFIIVSMSKHIVNERMSVVGMLRSIGGSIFSTGMLLIAESAFYGLCGGVLGTLLFLPMRKFSALGMTPPPVEGMEVHDGVNIFTVCPVIVLVILIQVLFSISAIMKAVKTPVRDIIFGTKDSVYIPSKLFAVTGVILLIASIVIYIVFENFMMMVLSVFCSVIGLVLVFPMVICFISKLLANLFSKLNMPVAKLAAKEIASTKSSVSSAQLIVSAVSATIAVLILSISVMKMVAAPVYHTSIIDQNPTRSGATYELVKTIDGVNDVEIIYYKYFMYDSYVMLNNEKCEAWLMGYPDGGFKYVSGISGCPEKLGEDEIALDKALANKLSLKVGDEIILGLNNEKYLKQELKLKVSTLIDALYFNNMGNTMMINLNRYKRIYYDEPTCVLIDSKPEKTFEVMEMLRATLPDNSMRIMTNEEFMIEVRSSVESILTILYSVIVLGIVLSLLGTSSNILMGFEQSRRKYAIFYSSSMSKNKLKKLIVIEAALMIVLSVASASAFSLYFLNVIGKALTMINMTVVLVSPVLYSAIFGVTASLLMMIVVIKPVSMLSKMDIVKEIKTDSD